MLFPLLAFAQEYHGEMERIYPDAPATTAPKPASKSAAKGVPRRPAFQEELPSTLIPRLQQLGAQLLKGKTGSIVAEDPATGEILCLVTNSPQGSSDALAIATAYAPGSTFKTAQALTLLSEGIVGMQTKIPCRGSFRDGSIRVGCHAHATPLPVQGALAYSCNTWFLSAFRTMIAKTSKYGSKEKAIDVWNKYITSMGLGGPLGIDLPGEKGGLVANSSYLARRYPGGWNPLTVFWAGIGQGDITATPLQLCNLAASIANRGWFFTPHVHRGTPGRPLAARYTTPRHTLVEPAAYSPVVQGMRLAVTRGTARAQNSRHYVLCGKTGTVENAGPDHSVFIGFAPMDRPRIAIAVFVEHGGFGADVAAPIAGKIVGEFLAS
ncbi:hypothetical protein JCM15908A_12710 [Prevotella dentasini JCM 15908]